MPSKSLKAKLVEPHRVSAEERQMLALIHDLLAITKPYTRSEAELAFHLAMRLRYRLPPPRDQDCCDCKITVTTS